MVTQIAVERTEMAADWHAESRFGFALVNVADGSVKDGGQTLPGENSAGDDHRLSHGPPNGETLADQCAAMVNRMPKMTATLAHQLSKQCSHKTRDAGSDAHSPGEDITTQRR
jgi:hypothetical protein